MKNLNAFNFITLNGFYKGPGNDLSWHSHEDKEGNDLAKEGANSGSMLLFGRLTYEMMASYWPSEMAMKNDPVVAKGMNNSEKIVFSNSLKKADWKNTRIISNNIIEEVIKLKEGQGNMTILGSGSIITQLTDAGLIDEYQFMLDPVAIGDGTAVFTGIKQKLNLELISSKVFKSGAILLSYRPKK